MTLAAIHSACSSKVEVPTINCQLKKVFSDSEFEEEAVIRNFPTTSADGKSSDTKPYSLSAIIAEGYKVHPAKVLGDDTLKTIAREVVDTVRRNVTIDWAVKESVRAKLRVIVKRIVCKYGYPPDKQEAATNTVLQQAELFSDFWTEGARA